MKHTPLYDEHLALGARMVPFGEWEMPERYTSIIDEHRATRSAAGLFDLSHMGEFYVSGPGAEPLLRWLLTNDIDTLAVDGALYSPMCRDDGGIVDDIIVYRLGFTSPHFLLVVNAANIAKDWDWIVETTRRLHLERDLELDNRSDDTALVALQGPLAQAILQPLVVDRLGDLKPFTALAADITDAMEGLISRTGYTGEDGFEIFINRSEAVTVWRLLLECGRDAGVVPVGLGARDTLRLEARLALYGNDIDDTTTPLEAGLDRWVKLDGRDFCGRDALIRQQSEGVTRRLVGLEMGDRAVPRSHYPVLCDGRQIGHITSGTFSPSLSKGIALAYVDVDAAPIGATLDVAIRDQTHRARVVKTPFYRRPALL